MLFSLTTMNVKQLFSIFFLMVLSAPVFAWGPVTHIYMAASADAKAPDRGSFYAATTEPDIGAGGLNIASKGVSSSYGVYHDPDFIEAMVEVAQMKDEPEKSKLLSHAAGYKSHKISDSVAHAVKGYPNGKIVFSKAQNYKTNHTCAEFFTDVLCYAKDPKQFENLDLTFIDSKTLAEVTRLYAARKGSNIPVDEKSLKKSILKHQATVLIDIALCKYLVKNRPDLVKELDSFFADRKDGIDASTGGIEKSIELQKDLASSFSFPSGMMEQNGIQNYVDELADRLVDKSLEDSASLILKLGNVDFVHQNLEKLLAAKLNSLDPADKPIANLFNNVFFTRMSFKESIFQAQNFIVPDDESSRATELKVELDYLKEKMLQAQQDWKNRPFWKFWLYFTDSDKKKYEALKKEFDEKSALYQGMLKKEVPLPEQLKKLSLSGLEYQRYIAANNMVTSLLDQGRAGTPEYQEAYRELLEAKKQLDQNRKKP